MLDGSFKKPVDILSNMANLSISHIGQWKGIGEGIKASFLPDLRLASTDAQKQMNLVGKILLKR